MNVDIREVPTEELLRRIDLVAAELSRRYHGTSLRYEANKIGRVAENFRRVRDRVCIIAYADRIRDKMEVEDE